MEHYEEEKPKIPTNLLVFIVISALVIAFSIYYITNSPKNTVSDELASSEMVEGESLSENPATETSDENADASSDAGTDEESSDSESNKDSKSSDESDESEVSSDDMKAVKNARENRDDEVVEEVKSKPRTISAPKKSEAKTTAKKTSSKVTRVSYDGPTHTHTVKKNEFMSSIASMYNFPSSEIKNLNDLDSDQLRVGTKVKVKIQAIHKVKSGEQLGKIAEKYHVKKSDLTKINGISSEAKLKEGQKLIIPFRSPKI